MREWEKTFNDVKKLNLPDVDDERLLYSVTLAYRRVDESYANS